MPKFLIERNVPGAGALSATEIQAMSQQSCAVVRELPTVEWQHSYVTGDKIYCVYIAPDEAVIREHGRRGGFPVDRVERIARIIDPTTAE